MGIWDWLTGAKKASQSGKSAAKDSVVLVRKDITDPEKQVAMGRAFYSGDGVPQSDTEAKKWFRKAADQGHREAQFSVAVEYHKAGNTKEAYRWYLKAAEQGHASAQRTVGVAYLNGEVMPKNIGTGVRWLEKAAAQGDGGALFNLGACYYNGQGVQQEEGKAVELFRRAAAAGHDGAAQALTQLGVR